MNTQDRVLAALMISGLLLTLFVLLSDSQQKQQHPELHPAGGTVMYKGLPVDNAIVTFSPMTFSSSREGGIKTAMGQTDEEGKFTLRTSGHDGVIKGIFNVTVSAIEVIDLSGLPEPIIKYRIPPKYGNPTTSGLQFEVTGEEEHNFEIVLND